MADPIRQSEQRFTYRDYRSWPDGERWELIDGVAWDMSPAPRRVHQLVAARLYAAFARACETGTPSDRSCRWYPAPFDVFLPADPAADEDDVDTVVRPDLTLICDPERETPRGCFGPPSLVVEIVSPYTLAKDLHQKRGVYERAAVPEYWLVDPGNRSVLVFRLGAEGRYPEAPIVYTDGAVDSTLLPPLCVDLAALVADVS